MLGITADSMTLMKHAHMTANEYFIHSVEYIDNVFGEGYAEKHPELVAEFMRTAAIDFMTASITAGIEGVAESLEKIAESIDGVANSIDSGE